LIAATNKNLEKAVQQEKFRQDLFYRLNVVPLEMPPLRQMKDDILLLAQYFVSRLCQKMPRKVRGISPEAQKFLLQYDWPGNVRELQNVIERALLLGSTEFVLPEDLPEALLMAKSKENGASTYHDALNEYKKQLVFKAFEGTNVNYQEAASRLGLHVSNLYRLVHNLKLEDLLKK
jgi:transcriptional regulator with PAS, ATPase and Fis domain